MTIDELIDWADRIALEEAAFNAEARGWVPDEPRFGDPLKAVHDLSGSRKWLLIAGWLRQARKEAEG